MGSQSANLVTIPVPPVMMLFPASPATVLLIIGRCHHLDYVAVYQGIMTMARTSYVAPAMHRVWAALAPLRLSAPDAYPQTTVLSIPLQRHALASLDTMRTILSLLTAQPATAPA